MSPQIETWDLTPLPSSSYSELIHLEPIGIGTPYTESFTSYITRLAMSHCVTPKELFMRFLWPKRGESAWAEDGTFRPKVYRRLNVIFRTSAILNSRTEETQIWVDLVGELTERNDLQYLTLLPWAAIVALQGLCPEWRTWCPHCYVHWRSRNQVVYDPLLWVVKPVTVCPIHRHPLVDQCPHCHKRMRWINSYSKPGYCSFCRKWLGSDKSFELNREQVVNGLEVANAVGDLIAGAAEAGFILQREFFSAVISKWIEVATGSVRRFSENGGVGKYNVYAWRRGQCIPMIGTFLRLCKGLKVSPKLIFEDDHTAVRATLAHLRSETSTARSSRAKLNLAQVRLKLEAAIAQDGTPPSFFRVAREIGHTPEAIRRHFPLLSRRISKRYRDYRDKQRKLKRNHARRVLEYALKDKSCSPPSLLAVCRDNSLVASTVYGWFPDLCRAVSAKFKEHKAQQRERKLQALRREVRNSVNELYDSGELPTLAKVVKVLGSPPYIRTRPVFREAFETAVSELELTLS